LSRRPELTTTGQSKPDEAIRDFWDYPLPEPLPASEDELVSLRATVRAQHKIIAALMDEIRQLEFRSENNV